MLRCTSVAAVVGLAGAMTCPGSPASLFHAGMKITSTAAASCDTVKAEMAARIAGTNGWYDQHNKGTYTSQSYGGDFSASRVTGDGKYTDKIIYDFTGSGNTCTIEACSESQVTSYADFGTNYCELKLLYCGTDEGCKVATSDFTNSGEKTEARAGASTGMSNCLKVEVAPALTAEDCVKHCYYDNVDHCCNKSPFDKDDRVVCGPASSDWKKPDECTPPPSFTGATDTCSLYSIDGDVCGQSDIDCKYTSYAKAAEKSLKDGTCASQGYTVKGTSTTKSYPIIGDITITQYTKPSATPEILSTGATDTCSLFSIDGDVCGQSDIDCKYTSYAKAAEKSLQDGTCASQGYTVKGTSTTKSYPIIGDITITQYTKPAATPEILLTGAADTCSLYSIDGDVCGQSDIDCKYTSYAKAAEKSLQDGTCASQGYTVKGTSTTKSYPIIGDITITQYTKASATPEVLFTGLTDTCSLYSIDGDVCGQSDIDCKYTSYAKAAEKSLQDGTCASQGYTVKGTSTTKSYPIIGDITITQYTKPSVSAIIV